MVEFDIWLAKHIFVPPVFKFLRWTQMTQYAFYRYAWMIYCLMALYAVRLTSIVAVIFFGFLSVFWIVQAGLHANKPVRENYFVRTLVLAVTVGNIVGTALSSNLMEFIQDSSIWADILVLFGQYALLIDKVPPRVKKKKTVKARAGAKKEALA